MTSDDFIIIKMNDQNGDFYFMRKKCNAINIEMNWWVKSIIVDFTWHKMIIGECGATYKCMFIVQVQNFIQNCLF